jgi:hypothetical protein
LIKNKFLTISSVGLGLALVALMTISVFAANDVPRMSKEKLKELLGNPNVIILDVRHSENWIDGEYKIKGAVRRRPKFFESWANEFPRDKVLFLY